MDNGDVLQAVAMALAVRSRMIHAPLITSKITLDLVNNALEPQQMLPMTVRLVEQPSSIIKKPFRNGFVQQPSLGCGELNVYFLKLTRRCRFSALLEPE